MLTIQTILKILYGVLGLALLMLLYFVQKIFRSNKAFIINSDNTITIKTFIQKKPYITSDDGMYPLTTDAALTSRNFPFWRKYYFFDEGSAKPKILLHKKDEWLSTQAITKIINDEHIKAMTGKIIEPALKLFIILGAIAGFLAAIASIINLVNQLGLVK